MNLFLQCLNFIMYGSAVLIHPNNDSPHTDGYKKLIIIHALINKKKQLLHIHCQG